MINIYCYTWNLFLPPEKIIDSTCGYHAIRNGNLMLNLLKNSKINYKNYVNSIKKSNYFKKLKSTCEMENEILKYQNTYKSNSLSKSDLQLIIDDNLLSKDIIITYVDERNMFSDLENVKIRKLLTKNKYKLCVVFFKVKFNVIKHWIPIVFDKNEKNVHVHILDSYDMSWYGDPLIDKIIDNIYPVNKRILCKREMIKGDMYYNVTKLIYIIILILVVYLFIYGMFEVKNL